MKNFNLILLNIFFVFHSCATHNTITSNNSFNNIINTQVNSEIIPEIIDYDRAIFLNNRRSMKIGNKTYNVYLDSDPIAPTRGERILDMEGILDYYMWIHKGDDGYFTISIIDLDLNVYYYNSNTEKYINIPNNTFIHIDTGKIELIE